MYGYQKYSKSYKLYINGKLNLDILSKTIFNKLDFYENNFNLKEIKYSTFFFSIMDDSISKKVETNPLDIIYTIDKHRKHSYEMIPSEKTCIKFSGDLTKEEIIKGINYILNLISEKNNIENLEINGCSLYFTPKSDQECIITDYNNNKLESCSIIIKDGIETSNRSVYKSDNDLYSAIRKIRTDNETLKLTAIQYMQYKDISKDFENIINLEIDELCDKYLSNIDNFSSIIDFLKEQPNNNVLLNLFDLNHVKSKKIIDVNKKDDSVENQSLYLFLKLFINNERETIKIIKKEELKKKRKIAKEKKLIEEELKSIEKEKKDKILIISNKLKKKYPKEKYILTVKIRSRSTVIKYLGEEHKHLYEKNKEYCVATIKDKKQNFLGCQIYDDFFSLIVDKINHIDNLKNT